MKQTAPFSIHIPAPCAENWNEMLPDAHGRFCGHCQTTVVDFTTMTDKELVDYFSTTSGRVCGRFMAEQLNRETVIPRESGKPFISIAAMLSALYFFIPAVKAQVNPVTAQAPGQRTDTNGLASKPIPLNIVITGTVTSSKPEEYLPGVTIRIKGTNSGTQTDDKGHFKLRVPSHYTGTVATLAFNFVGFDNQEINVSLLQQQEPLCVILNDSSSILTGDVVIIRRPTRWRRIKHKVSSIFR